MENFKLNTKYILIEMIAAFAGSTIWYFMRSGFASVPVVNEIEPMLVGIIIAIIAHLLSKFNLNNAITVAKQQSQ